jgi:hypothetical protein
LVREQANWQKTVAVAQDLYNSEGFFKLEDFLHPLERAFTRHFADYLDRQKFYIRDSVNGKTKGSYWQHCNDYAFYIQEQMAVIFNQVLPYQIKAGHNAMTRYERDAVLPSHKDDVTRFKYVATLVLDGSPDSVREKMWPLYVRVGEKSSAIQLGVGDVGIIDPQCPHWRDQFEGESLTVMLCWFVDRKFRGYVNGKLLA